MTDPIKIEAKVDAKIDAKVDLTEGVTTLARSTGNFIDGLTNWLTLVPHGVRTVGSLIRDWRDDRRSRNALAVLEGATPLLNGDAQAPDDDWVDEFLDLAGKRSKADFQKMLSRLFALECNTPDSVPLRYINFMAALDRDVLEEFAYYLGWYDPSWRRVIKGGSDVPNPIPQYVVQANLITYHPLGYQGTLRNDQGASSAFSDGDQHYRFSFPPGADVPLGHYSLTGFGKMVLELLDHRPVLRKEALTERVELWKAFKTEAAG